MKCLSLTYSPVNFVRSENTPGLRCWILFDFIHLRKKCLPVFLDKVSDTPGDFIAYRGELMWQT